MMQATILHPAEIKLATRELKLAANDLKFECKIHQHRKLKPNIGHGKFKSRQCVES